MRYFSLMTWLFLSGFFTQTNAFADSCGAMMDYPTCWEIHNQRSTPVWVECRNYSSTNGLRNEAWHVPAHAVVVHRFADHNDGMGMLQRDWNCAYSTGPFPLSSPRSQGKAFHGTYNDRLTIPNALADATSSPSRPVAPQQLASFCPEVQELRNLQHCNSRGCQWQAYGTDHWSGNFSPVVSEQELRNFRFVGVDAGLDRSVGVDAALGCVYLSAQRKSYLVLRPAAPQPPYETPRYYYGPVRSHDFSKRVGNLKQCLSNRPQDCPLLYVSVRR